MRQFLPLTILLPLLAGCALSPAAPSTPEAGPAIVGNVHGGQQPLVGAHVYLYAANTAGNGGNGIVASASNASQSLLLPAANTTADSNNNYFVTTDANGDFSITGDYSCSTGQQVYLYGQLGNSGSGTNSAAGLLAVLGSCPTGSTNFATATPFISVNEVSTVAAAYALAGFATDAVHISSDSGVNTNSYASLSATGIANAFANAANLANLSTGTALATTPAGNGTVPQTTINTLANILAACVNTAGPSSTTPNGCNTLLGTATSNGVPVGSTGAGTEPSDTATAAIYIAQNPGANVSTLFNNVSSTPPFANALSTVPNDFTIGINFTGNNLDQPDAIAIDNSGDAWIANHSGNRITELTSTGAAATNSPYFTTDLNGPDSIAMDRSGNVWVSNSAAFTVLEFIVSGSTVSVNSFSGDGLSTPHGVVIDGSGDAWIANGGGTNVTKLTVSGSTVTGKAHADTGLDASYGIAIDGSGNAWVASEGNSSVSELNSSGTVLSTTAYTGGGLNQPYAIAIDGSGNAWLANYSGNSITELTNSGTAVSPNGYTGGGLNKPYAIAIDGSGNAWIANEGGNSVTWISSSGSVLSPNGYTGGSMNAPYAIAIDGSGDAWIANYSSNSVTEQIGVATPVITPICAGLPSTTTRNGTSSLGTRP